MMRRKTRFGLYYVNYRSVTNDLVVLVDTAEVVSMEESTLAASAAQAPFRRSQGKAA